MSYLKGSGSSVDPWVIHNAAALKYYFETGGLVAGYAVLVNDIDMTGTTVSLKSGAQWICQLDGYGYAIRNLTLSGPNNYVRTTWKRLRFIKLTSSNNLFIGYNSAESFIVDCEFDDISIPAHTSYITFNRCVVKGMSANIVNYYSTTSCYVVDGMYLFSKFTNLTSTPDKYNASNYPALAALATLWLIDGASMPRLKAQSSSALTRAYAIKGLTKVGGIPRSRTVSCHSPVDFNQIAKGKSLGDGSYSLNCGLYTDHVAVVHSDDYGKLFAANYAYALGDVVHPSTTNGCRYICTTAGTSASTEPTNWPTTGTLTTGSAIFTAQPVYKPEAFIAVPVLIDLITGLPV
jgi:hypothetical protein